MAKVYKKQIQDLTVNRGDAAEIKFTLPGDLTAENIYFTVKPDRELSSDRYVEKKNDIAGGSTSEILATVSGTKTVLTVFLAIEDTQDLTDLTLVYDVWVEFVSNPTTSSFTYVDGSFALLGDVRTPFDGFATPETAIRFQQLDAEDYPVNSLFQISKDGGGVSSFIAIELADVLDQLGLVNSVIPNNAIWKHTGLKSGTLASPPSGLVVNEVWEDTTDSATQVALRLSKITT